MPSLNSLVLSLRVLVEGTLGLGKDWENDRVRIHRYADHFRVFDLTNAGKKGKSVSVLIASPGQAARDASAWMERQSRWVVLNARTYDTVRDYFAGLGDEVQVSTKVTRGVDIRSRADREIEAAWSIGDQTLQLTASPLDFSMMKRVKMPTVNPGKEYYQDTLFWPAGRKDAEKFYKWASDHERELDRMDMDGFRGVWSKLGVRYSSH